jgi:hypothetical protein
MNDFRQGSPERAAVVQHLTECTECEQYEREIGYVTLGLRELKPQRPPVDLTYRLRVIASHERARMIAGSNWFSLLRFRLNQILRPLAVPAAGGIFASLLFFAILAPSFTVHASNIKDVPIGVFTPVSILDQSPFTFHSPDIMLELTIDENGNVTDYNVPSGTLTRDEMRAIGNVVLFTSFKAATAYGRPVPSKLLLNIAHIDVGS